MDAVLWFLLLLFGAAADTIPFSSGEVAVRAGGLWPLGSLSRHYDPTLRGGASLTMTHWGTVFSRADLAYAHLSGDVSESFLYGSAGFDWHPANVPVEPGVSLVLVRVASTHPDPAVPRQIDGGETEFGLTFRTAVPVWRHGPWTVRLEGQWDEVFTRPHASAFAWAGLSLARRAW